MNDVYMHIVTPEFLTGGPANLNQTKWMYDWRREQYLTGLERKHTRHRKLLSQTIDGERLFNVKSGCNDVECSAVQEYVMNKRYQRSMNPFDCLTAYSNIYGNRSHVIFVSNYDYLWNSSTLIPHFAFNGSDILVGEDVSSSGDPINNTLLFSKQVPDVMVVGFWMEYDWLCGTTNNFDCESEYVQVCLPEMALTEKQVDNHACGLRIRLSSRIGTYLVGRLTNALSQRRHLKRNAQ